MQPGREGALRGGALSHTSRMWLGTWGCARTCTVGEALPHHCPPLAPGFAHGALIISVWPSRPLYPLSLPASRCCSWVSGRQRAGSLESRLSCDCSQPTGLTPGSPCRSQERATADLTGLRLTFRSGKCSAGWEGCFRGPGVSQTAPHAQPHP